MRRASWTAIFLGAGAVLLVALTLYAARQQVHAYYERALEPERLGTPVDAAPPKSFRLTDVPWISSDLELASSLSFAMLAAQQGKDEPRQKIDFLMGTTWGATPIPRQIGFWPGQDPELGFRPAAATLGFARHYLVTDDAERYLHELKAQLSGGRAVRVAVDLVTLEKRQQEDPIAHSVVLVGYDELPHRLSVAELAGPTSGLPRLLPAPVLPHRAGLLGARRGVLRAVVAAGDGRHHAAVAVPHLHREPVHRLQRRAPSLTCGRSAWRSTSTWSSPCSPSCSSSCGPSGGPGPGGLGTRWRGAASSPLAHPPARSRELLL